MSQRPVAIGLFVCDQVIVEEGTRNVTPVNCFTHRTAPSFPSEPFPFMVFALLTDGAGEISLEMAIQRLDTFDEIYRRTLRARFANPLQEARCLFHVRDCSFPVAGYYQVRLLADKEFVAQRRLRISSTLENPL